MKTWAEQQAAEKGRPKDECEAMRKAWLKELSPQFNSICAAAKALGMTDGSLRTMALKHGVTMPKGVSGFQPWIPVDEIRRLAAEGFVAVEIAEKIGCSKHQVYHLSAKNGIEITSQRSLAREVATDAPAAPPPRRQARPKPGTMAWYAAREVAEMRKAGLL